MKPTREFSKCVLVGVMVIYAMTVVFGYVYFAVLHKDEPMSLDGLFTFVGAPTGIAIGFYVWKAKCENIHKHPPGTIDIDKTKRVAEDETNTEGVYDYGNTEPNYTDSNSCSGSDSTDIPSVQSEEEVHRVVKVRRVKRRKTTRRGNGTA